MKTSSNLRRRPLVVGAGVAVAVAAGLAAAAPVAAAPSSASVAKDTLTVKGSSGNDLLALVVQAATPNLLQVDFGDDGTPEFEFDRGTFSRVEVTLGSGRDQFRVVSPVSLADEAMTIDGGSGDDNLLGGNGVELFIGGSGRDFVDGNQGNDTGVMGSGDDTFRWDPGDGSDIVEGASGFDTLDFNGAGAAETMSLSPQGERAIFLRNVANIRMDMDGIERLDLTALGGTDQVTIDDMSGTDFRQADVDLSGPAGGGDGANDIVAVNGTNRADDIDVSAENGRVEVEGLKTTVNIPGAELSDQLRVNALDGDDEVNVDAAAIALINVLVDLGAGES